MIRTKKLTSFDQFFPSNRKPKGDAIDKTIGIMNNRAIDIIEFIGKKGGEKFYPERILLLYFCCPNLASIVQLFPFMVLIACNIYPVCKAKS
jgi:hypothetical protein